MSAATDLLAELVRADTVGANEGDLARVCGALLEKAGMSGRYVDLEPGREQYVGLAGPDGPGSARSGAGVGGSGPLTFTGHLDTVPVGDGWSRDAWAAETDGDRMYGRGTSDMKSGVAALVVAVAEHVSRPHRCRGVQVVLTSGEETGCTGALEIPGSAVVPGGPLVVAEPTQNRLVPAHKGAHWMRVSATGRAAHGSAPELGDNAVVKLARAAVALHDHRDWPAQEGFGPVTANVGVFGGGVQVNVVPDAAELMLDVRTVPSVSGDSVRALVRSVAGSEVEVTDHLELPPVDTALDDPFVELVGSALAATGLDPAPAPPARYFTDAAALVRVLTTDGGPVTPTVVLGPGEPDQCHVDDEWCSLSRVDEAVAVYGELLSRWCG